MNGERWKNSNVEHDSIKCQIYSLFAFSAEKCTNRVNSRSLADFARAHAAQPTTTRLRFIDAPDSFQVHIPNLSWAVSCVSESEMGKFLVNISEFY